MKRRSTWLLAAGLILTACSDTDSERNLPEVSSNDPDRVAEAQRPRAGDDTGRNVRDRDDATVTPTDQPASGPDMEITRRIREAVTSDESLSMDAHNVKIITQDGAVTLRGPVESERERDAIAAFASQTEGVRRVDNQLEIDRDAAEE